jgi:hypothetical protein
MAIGQLADYGRLLPNAVRGTLLPIRPARQDLIDLARDQNIAIKAAELRKRVMSPTSPRTLAAVTTFTPTIAIRRGTRAWTNRLSSFRSRRSRR